MRKLVIVLLAGVFCLLGVTSALASGELPPVEERLPGGLDEGIDKPIDYSDGSHADSGVAASYST